MFCFPLRKYSLSPNRIHYQLPACIPPTANNVKMCHFPFSKTVDQLSLLSLLCSIKLKVKPNLCLVDQARANTPSSPGLVTREENSVLS